MADWFAYAHAGQTEKNTGNFGKGDIRGVIAPEASNNAKEGGGYIPTLAFGTLQCCGYRGASTEVTPRPASVWITSPVMMRDWDEASIT